MRDRLFATIVAILHCSVVILRVAPQTERLEIALVALTFDPLRDPLLLLTLTDLLFDVAELGLFLEALFFLNHFRFSVEDVLDALAHIIHLVEEFLRRLQIVWVGCHSLVLFLGLDF